VGYHDGVFRGICLATGATVLDHSRWPATRFVASWAVNRHFVTIGMHFLEKIRNKSKKKIRKN
jgi:hypothetical protein